MSINTLKNVDKEIVKEFAALPEEFWDFKGADTRELTHGLHNYPAVMIYPISRNIISIMQKHQKMESFLDLFMGSGTTLVEAKIAGFDKIYGTDLNPLSILISKVKTRNLDEELLNNKINELKLKIEANYLDSKVLLDNINNYIDDNKIDVTAKHGWGNEANLILKDFYSKYNKQLDTPNFTNMGYWFKPKVILELQLIKDAILTFDEDFKEFFLLALSEAARYSCNTRNGEFKLFRMELAKVTKFNPNPLTEYYKILERNTAKIFEFNERSNNDGKVYINFEDARELNSIPDNSIDLMITSPPYGDSQTTVAYGQFSRPALWWLDLEYMEQSTLNAVDKNLLGGIKVNKKYKYELSSDVLKKSLAVITDVDPERARDVSSFYEDLDKTIGAVTKKMKLNSYQFWVVANRTVKEEVLLTDRIIVELSEKYGLVEVMDIGRYISNKVMPSKNSPTNVAGKTVATMTNEHILILRKDRE